MSHLSIRVCSLTLICDQSEQLLAGKNAIQKQLDTHPSTLDDLDELGEIMTEMLHRQETVEVGVTYLYLPGYI